MTYFWPGVAAIWGALLAGLASVVLYVRVDRGRKDLLHAARSAYATFVTCILAASGVLLALLLQHRFDVSYVNAYSSRDLPLHFLISTVWGGQEGSFLLWCFWGAVIGRPGLMKTTALSEPLKPVRRLEADARERRAAAMVSFQADSWSRSSSVRISSSQTAVFVFCKPELRMHNTCWQKRRTVTSSYKPGL